MANTNRRGIPMPFVSRARRVEPPSPVAPAPVEEASSRRASMVDSAIYADGIRVASPATLAETYAALDRTRGGVAWIGLYRPSEHELMSLSEEFNLHPLAIEDAIVAHQRPKLERYDTVLFVVLKAANYLDAPEEVDFGELHVFVGPNFVITVRHSESPDLSHVRQRMEGEPELLALGPQAILYAIIDAVVDAYGPVVAGLANDIDEIETQVFGGDALVSRRIYELSREVIDFQRATHPLSAVMIALERGSAKYGVTQELERRLRDVADHLTQVNERVDAFRYLLRDILTVNSTLVSERQNEEMTRLAHSSHRQGEEVKKISSWAAILFTPTLIAGIYGMNFRNMPELQWPLGYPLAVLAMVVFSGVLYGIFKRRGWL
ncbi:MULTISPECIES: magnesium and cobalt transport protein CorA [unclassified Leifsonia]|uniref:magnesium and cobalt transport protein CorA n=1 Tax=unclassified Leifsonia TaxID=2663824 RepID=UPI0008A7FA93|nr:MULTISPECIES: magnesium and cobalt transport protein CorA [unclassified Leifsonia]SEH78415.1 magnesium transporter [Leifsonia sp. CL154]SFL40548.1 magnesium transporter [Leifsonia sp. CL147]